MPRVVGTTDFGDQASDLGVVECVGWPGSAEDGDAGAVCSLTDTVKPSLRILSRCASSSAGDVVKGIEIGGIDREGDHRTRGQRRLPR